jgi:hypothetical protein
MLISAGAARRLFGDEDPVGHRLRLAEDLGVRQIVGVTGDVPPPNARSSSIGELYLPWDGDASTMLLMARAPVDVLRAAVRELDPRQVIEHPSSVARILAEHRAEPMLVTWIVGITASIALVLAALGIFGLVSYSVGQRTREIGIRAALGATAGRIMRDVMRHTLLLIGVGLVLGLALAVPVTKMMARAMTMPGGDQVGLPLAVVALLFAAVAFVAGLLPARRATKVDPMIALRAE